MKELNEHIEFLEMTEDSPQLLVWLLELRRHREDNWKQRAEAAEEKLAEVEQQKSQWVNWAKEGCAEADKLKAKLAELQKQEPAAFTSPFYWKELNESGRVNCWLRNDRRDPDFNIELFTRPAPAVSLADLVPERLPMDIPFAGHRLRNGGWNDCIDAILRNIEEQSL